MVKNLPVLVDSSGRPMKAFHSNPFEGASRSSRELGSWHPGTFTADSEVLPNLETLRDRTDDIIRNHGLASGAVQTHVDNIIGTGLRLNAKPDRVMLGVGEDQNRQEELDELENIIEAKFKAWAEDPNCYVDASRRSRLSGLLAQAYRTYLTAFEIVASGEWLERPGCKYNTAIQLIDPRRLSNPDGGFNSERLRAGVALGAMGDPRGYFIASHIDVDPYVQTAKTWTFVPRETPWGRPLLIHIYDNDKPGQSRGRSSLASVLQKHKMVDKFEKASLEASIFNAMYAAYVQSSLDWPSVASAVGAGDPNSDPTIQYMQNVGEFHKDATIYYNGIKIPHLFPGEDLKLLTPQHPAPAFNAFEEASLRYLAAGWNLTYEQLSRDYSKTNYSSSRAAMLETWRFFRGKQYYIGGRFAGMIYSMWLEEAVDKGEVVLPAWAPDFLEERSAWTACDWIGPGRGHIDPIKEANATTVELENGLTTLEIEAANRGRSWRELIDQRAQEKRYMEKVGMTTEPEPEAVPPEQFGERAGDAPGDNPNREDPEAVPAPTTEEVDDGQNQAKRKRAV